jgi:hypothetical protein
MTTPSERKDTRSVGLFRRLTAGRYVELLAIQVASAGTNPKRSIRDAVTSLVGCSQRLSETITFRPQNVKTPENLTILLDSETSDAHRSMIPREWF